MKIKKKLTVFLLAIISLFTVLCFSGCSSITIDGKKLRNPNCIYLLETGFSSHVDILTDEEDIDEVFSLFNGAKFVLSDEALTESDGNIFRAIHVDLIFGERNYSFNIAENGKAVCYFGENTYISDENSVDYAALKEFINNLKEKK